MKTVLLAIILISSLSSYPQQLILEAVHFNQKDQPVRIERKYKDNSKLLYVTHLNWGSRCLQDEIIRNGDTTIIEETLFEIVRTEKQDIFTSLDGFAILLSDSGITKTLSLYNFERDEYLGDTTLPVEFDTEDFTYNLRHSRVNLILDAKINVPFDSMVFKEKTKTFYVNKIPMRIEFCNSKGVNQQITLCELSLNTMNCKSYNPNSVNELISSSTVNWNKDTTEIDWLLKVERWEKTYFTKYLIDDKQLIKCETQHQDTILFLNKKAIFTNLVTEHLIYTDFPFTFHLKFDFDLQNIAERKSKNYHETRKYNFDEKERIKEETIIINDTLYRTIEYKYY